MPATWVDRLLPGERIIWEGAPPKGFIFRWYDVPMTLFGQLDGRHRPLPSFERIADAHHVMALVHRPPPPPPPRPGAVLHS